jgi:hypothetical protein
VLWKLRKRNLVVRFDVLVAQVTIGRLKIEAADLADVPVDALRLASELGVSLQAPVKLVPTGFFKCPGRVTVGIIERRLSSGT